MKKSNLLASTALVSALVMGAGGAQALELKLGGYAEFWFGYADNESLTGVRNNLDVKHDAEIYFRAEEKLDNGMTVGFVAELEAGPGNDQGSGPPDDLGGGAQDTEWDEMYVYVKSNWGQINLGNNDNAAGYVGAVRTVGPVGIFKSDIGDWLPGTYGLNNTDVDLGFNDSQNITYFTPRVGGVQLIVSYTPDSGDPTVGTDWVEGAFDRQETAGAHHLFSGAARFSRKFGGVGVGLAAGYSHAEDAESTVSPTLEGYNAVVDLTFGPARLTANYAFEDLSGRREDEHWGVGLIYAIDKVNSVSIAYADGESLRSATRTVESEWVTAGWEHNMGKGVTFAASVFKGETEDGITGDTTGDNDGFGAVAGFVLRF